ncbi:RES family NAD+ phosphorylase [Nocardioides salarius]|uniref:RES family NAD+ phosphorylase n=1 Tax=Nocardioides salarius TaxID=374513 RepID=UPI00187A6A7E|nr:RES family NAD+ phosphorylase [Nocardioides salarius]
MVDFPDSVFRVARTTDPLRFSEIRPEDAVHPTAGNRYDVAGGGVLYAATQLQACFAETLGRYRPSPVMRDLLAGADGVDEHFMLCGGIPRDWRLRRSIVELSVSAPLPFLDVDHPETLAFLSRELAPQLAALGYTDNLDLSALRNADRRLSRSIALWAYAAQNDGDDFLFSGIRYASRLGDGWENWAIFDGTDVFRTSTRPVLESDEDLRTVARMWSLTVH